MHAVTGDRENGTHAAGADGRALSRALLHRRRADDLERIYLFVSGTGHRAAPKCCLLSCALEAHVDSHAVLVLGLGRVQTLPGLCFFIFEFLALGFWE